MQMWQCDPKSLLSPLLVSHFIGHSNRNCHSQRDLCAEKSRKVKNATYTKSVSIFYFQLRQKHVVNINMFKHMHLLLHEVEQFISETNSS